MKTAIHWFRRDLRLEDNTALAQALKGSDPVLTVFIFDALITEELPADDARITFIYELLENINKALIKRGSSLLIKQGQPVDVFRELLKNYDVSNIYFNRDYEPYARKRDSAVRELCEHHGIGVHILKDQVIFEADEVLKADGDPYTVFTPYKNKWIERYHDSQRPGKQGLASNNFFREKTGFPSLKALGFKQSKQQVVSPRLSVIRDYSRTRNLPALDGTTRLGPHLRFGSVSIRELVKKYLPVSEVFISELIWREFFMQVLFHHPEVVDNNFRSKYNGIHWRNNEEEFDAWCKGLTGYPMVDAGMRQLNESGYMHNRVRMITAGFLCKHLLIDWRWGEAYFAKKLLDYELSLNNGNWQWAAGTGCDAAPYFRIFNPAEQLKKFDQEHKYVNEWIPELGTDDYPAPIVEHRNARERALEEYKKGMDK